MGIDACRLPGYLSNEELRHASSKAVPFARSTYMLIAFENKDRLCLVVHLRIIGVLNRSGAFLLHFGPRRIRYFFKTLGDWNTPVEIFIMEHPYIG